MKFRQLIIILLISMFLCKIPDGLMEIKNRNIDLNKFFKGFDEIYINKAKLSYVDFKDFFKVLKDNKIKVKLAIVLKEYLTSDLNMKNIKINTQNMISNIKRIIKINLQNESFVWLRPHSHFIFMSHSEIEKVVFNAKPESQLLKVDEKTKLLNKRTPKIDKHYKTAITSSQLFLEIRSKRKKRNISKMKTKTKTKNFASLDTIAGVNKIDYNDTYQGKCGACWAYAHSTLLTYKFNKLAIQNKTEQKQMDAIFSPQILFDCFHKDSLELLGLDPKFSWVYGCKGGDSRSVSDGVLKLINKKFSFPNIKDLSFKNSLPSEASQNDGYGNYSKNRCKTQLKKKDPPSFSLEKQRWISEQLHNSNRNTFYKDLETYGPAVVLLGFTKGKGVYAFAFYEGGAITKLFCDTKIGIEIKYHNAVITGYIPDKLVDPEQSNLNPKTMEVWVVKNSWSHGKNLLISAEGDGNTCNIMEEAITYRNVDALTKDGCCSIF